MNPRPTNFSSFNDPQASYLTLLYEQSQIPSLSYSYSVGAKYRNNGVLGSLTLGGYSEGLFEPNDISFPFYFDQERDLTVGVQAITSQVGTKNISLLPSGILSFIDSTVTQIWLPDEACQLFENTFGLEYDNTTELYMLNNTQHTKLVNQNPNVTFTIGLTEQGGSTVDITFPYAAFDLNISYPTVQDSTWYFPLRRAANDTQYTLGRAFLQEAYLTVDYQRSNFSLSRRNWDSSSESHIVAISPPNSTTSSTPGGSSTAASKNAQKKSGISTGAIVGIVVAVVVLIAIGIGAFFFFRIRKRKHTEREAMAVAAAVTAANDENKDSPEGTLSPQPAGVTELYSPPKEHPELQGNYFQGHEVDAGDVQRRAELDAQARQAELEGEVVRYELEAPHGMHEMSNMRATRDDPRWGETTSPVSSPVSRKTVPSPRSQP